MADVYDSLTGQEYLTFIGELYGLDYDLADHKAKSLWSSLASVKRSCPDCILFKRNATKTINHFKLIT